MAKNLNYTFETRSFDALITREGARTWFTVLHPEYLATELNKFKEGERVSVYVTNKKPKRTEQQNRYYWGVYLPAIAAETGNDVDDLHALFKGLFLSKGIAMVLGHKVRKAKSTTELSTGKFLEYIQRIEQLTGVMAPPTDEFVMGKKEVMKEVDYPNYEGPTAFD